MWIDIKEEKILLAAQRKWSDVTAVSPPYWIDPEESLLRVGVLLADDCAFGACYNFQTNEFVG